MYGEARYICTAALIYQLIKKLTNISKSLKRPFALLFFIDPRKINSYNNPHLYSDHVDELEIFFETPEPFATSVVADAKDNALFYSMREYWTSFVTTGWPVSSNGIAWEVRFSLSSFEKNCQN